MEKSKDELLAGISKLSGLDPFPDEIFYQIFEIEDNVERTQYVEALRKEAGKLKRRPEFNNLYRAFVLDYSQRQKQTGKVTRFTDQPIELNCGEWEATDMGVKTVRYCDSAEQTLIAGMRTAVRKAGLGWIRIENALKTTINDRIRFMQRMLSQHRFFYVKDQCQSLEDALTTALWDEKKSLVEDVRLDDGTSDIDTLDAFEYTFERDISRFIRYE